MAKKGDGNGVRNDLNLCSIQWGFHFSALNESTELRCVHGGLAKERDINIPEARGIDSSHEAVQVLASSSIFEARESREKNMFLWRWRQVRVFSVGREGMEMERKISKIGYPSQGIRERFWGETPRTRNFVELNVSEVLTVRN